MNNAAVDLDIEEQTANYRRQVRTKRLTYETSLLIHGMPAAE